MKTAQETGRPQRLEATQIKVEDVLFAMVKKLKDARRPLSKPARNWQDLLRQRRTAMYATESGTLI